MSQDIAAGRDAGASVSGYGDFSMRASAAFVRSVILGVGLCLFGVAAICGSTASAQPGDQSRRLVNVTPGQAVEVKEVYGASHALLIGVNKYPHIPANLQL